MESKRAPGGAQAVTLQGDVDERGADCSFKILHTHRSDAKDMVTSICALLIQ